MLTYQATWLERIIKIIFDVFNRFVSVCPYGFFGARCQSVCLCEESCFCNHVNGLCNNGTDYAILKQGIYSTNTSLTRHLYRF